MSRSLQTDTIRSALLPSSVLSSVSPVLIISLFLCIKLTVVILGFICLIDFLCLFLNLLRHLLPEMCLIQHRLIIFILLERGIILCSRNLSMQFYQSYCHAFPFLSRRIRLLSSGSLRLPV